MLELRTQAAAAALPELAICYCYLLLPSHIDYTAASPRVSLNTSALYSKGLMEQI